MKCACLCGQEFEPTRGNQKYLDASHREKMRNQRSPLKRVSKHKAALLDALGERQEANSAMVTMLRRSRTAKTKSRSQKPKYGIKESGEFLTAFQVAGLLGISSWMLQRWRTQGPLGGPPFVKIGKRTVRYPRQGFEAWLISQPGRHGELPVNIRHAGRSAER
jgi:hypothetical protein